MGGVLVLYWMYFSGNWGPANTKAFRQFCSRQFKLDKAVWVWGGLAALCIFLFVSVGFVFTFRVVEFKPEIFKTATYLNNMSLWWAWPLLIGASCVAGICEEFGFRGYMQKPLETKFGPVPGIAITSFIFVIVHLHQAWATGILVQIFGISFMIGYLAYATNSLLPGIIAHVSFDIINFSYWWSDVMGTFNLKPISMTGVDAHFLITLSVVLLSLVVFIISIRKLLKGKRDLQPAKEDTIGFSTAS